MTRFTHAKYGYSFDYPSDWIVDPNATDEYLAVYRDYPGTGADKIEFVILDNAELLPLEEWISKQEVSAPIKMTSESTVEWSVDGAPGTRKVASAQGFTFHVAYLAIRDKVLIVNGPWTDSSMVVDLEKLLSTLRLNQ